MSNSESSSNTAIVALSVLALAAAAGIFIYYQGGFGATEVVHKQTIIENVVPASQPEPKAEEPGYTLEHEDDDGNKTTIQAP